jgi:phage terminase large subunit-like protein
MATNLEFIKSASGTQVSTLDVTDCFSDKYDVYKITFNGTNTNTNGIYSAFRVIVGGTAQASGYDNATLFLKSYQAFTEERRPSAGDFENVSYMGTGNNNGTFGSVIYIFNPYDSSSYTFAKYQSSNDIGLGSKTIAVYKVADQVTGLQFKPENAYSSAKFDMDISVYGVK